MRNFVVFTNSILLTSALYIFSYYFVISEHYLQLLGNDKYTSTYATVNMYNQALFLIMFLPELFMPVLRPLSAIASFYIMYSQTMLLFGTLLTYQIGFIIYYASTSFAFATSLKYCLEYQYLAY